MVQAVPCAVLYKAGSEVVSEDGAFKRVLVEKGVDWVDAVEVGCQQVVNRYLGVTMPIEM